MSWPQLTEDAAAWLAAALADTHPGHRWLEHL